MQVLEYVTVEWHCKTTFSIGSLSADISDAAWMLDHGLKATRGQIQHLGPSKDTDGLGAFLYSHKEHQRAYMWGWTWLGENNCVCFYLL